MKETFLKQGYKADQEEGVFESVMDAEGIEVPMARAVGRLEYRTARKKKGKFSEAMEDLGGKAATKKPVEGKQFSGRK
jgi:predicted nucleic-acid-binding protein